MNIDVRTAITQSGSEECKRVTVNVWDSDSPELRAILTEHFPVWAELFASKNSEYGSGSAFELGERGQFSDIYRKIIKLKRAMWDEDESVLTTEGVDEIIMDLIGHCFLTLEMRRRSRDKGELKDEKTDPVQHSHGFEEDCPGCQPQPEKTPERSIGNLCIGDKVGLKQHLGKGRLLRVAKIDSERSDGLTVMVTEENGLVGMWAHPTWLVPEGEKSAEEQFLADNGMKGFAIRDEPQA